MKTAGETLEFKCLIRATDGKKNISTMVIITIESLLPFSITFFLQVLSFSPFFCFVGHYVLWNIEGVSLLYELFFSISLNVQI